MSKPTNEAQASFSTARQDAEKAVNFIRSQQILSKIDRSGDVELANAVASMALGLYHLSVGLRATYVLLEEINRKLHK